MPVVLTISEQNAVVEWLAVLFHICKVTESGLCPQTSCSDLVFHRFPTVCPDNCQFRTVNSFISASFYILSDSLSTVICHYIILKLEVSLSKLRIKIKNDVHLVKAVDVNRTKASGTNIAYYDFFRGSSVKVN
jgi:hypothetical protein